MNNRAEVLFLAHRIPYPPDKGDKIRSWRLLNFLLERHDVHLACFVDDAADMRHEARLASLCESVVLVPLRPLAARVKSLRGLATSEPLSLAYFRDARMRQAVERLRRRPLAAEIVFSSTMAQYVETPAPGRVRIVDFCDADSEKFAAYAETAGVPINWIYAREGRLLARAENEIANWADASFAITPEEAARFNERADVRRRVDWWSNGVDAGYFDPEADFSPIPRPADVVFTGAMDYRANIDAVLFFTANVWPAVRNAQPDASFAIVGARPASAVKALDGKDGVRVAGRVDDVRPWIGGAKLAVAPMRVARGVQNKVLEAMAMAKPVVATTEAAAGLLLAPGEDILVADKPKDFSDAVIQCLSDAQLSARIGAAARARVIADYQWVRQLARFGDALAAVSSSSETAAAAG